jgi:hypothetical protein
MFLPNLFLYARNVGGLGEEDINRLEIKSKIPKHFRYSQLSSRFPKWHIRKKRV